MLFDCYSCLVIFHLLLVFVTAVMLEKKKEAFADLLLFINLFCQYERQSEKDDVQKKTEEVDAELKAEFEELHHLLTSKVGYGEEE